MPLELRPEGLPDYVHGLMLEAIGRSGYPVVVEERPSLEFDSEMQLARGSRRYHKLVISTPYVDHAEHFIISGAKKIIRFYEQSPEQRYLPGSRATQGLPEQEKGELSSGPWSELRLAELSDFLYQGTVRQLTSYPVDLRVEREIAEEFPEHREKQRAYLRRQVSDFEPSFLPEMAEAFPDRVSRANQAMNVAFAEKVAEITGHPVGDACRACPHHELGERLREDLDTVQEPGAQGDRQVTDAWARRLGLRQWYEWTQLD